MQRAILFLILVITFSQHIYCHVYVDAAYGFSKLVTASKSKTNIYAYDSGLKWFPFVNIGVRFNLSKSAEK